jgi:hypothetical protein
MSIEIAGLLTHFFQNCQTSENSSTQLQHKELPKVKTTLTKVNGSWYSSAGMIQKGNFMLC